jgi:hypothetical protein
VNTVAAARSRRAHKTVAGWLKTAYFCRRMFEFTEIGRTSANPPGHCGPVAFYPAIRYIDCWKVL